MEPTWPTSAEVADTIKSAITAAGLSQREVADLTGIPPTTLNRRLTANGSALTYGEMVAIGRVIGRPVSDLITEAERASASAAA
jgi:transcriptional regulator with XRE-family HTH domain